MSASPEYVDAMLAALGAPRPVGSLADVQAIMATEMGLHRCTVRVRLDGSRCVVEVPAEDVDAKRRGCVDRAMREASRCAAKAGATEIEIVLVGSSRGLPA